MLRDTLTLTTTRVVAAGFSIVTLAIATNDLGIDSFGELAVLQSLVAVAILAFDVRPWEIIVADLPAALVDERPADAAAVVLLGHRIAALSVGAAFGLTMVVSFAVARSQVVLLALAMLVAGSGAVLQVTVTVLRTLDRYLVTGLWQASGAVILLGCTLGLHVTDRLTLTTYLAVQALSAGLVMAALLVSGWLALRRRGVLLDHAAPVDLRGSRSRFAGGWFYGSLKIVRELDILLVRVVSGPVAAGAYALARRLVRRLDLVLEPISSVAQVEISKSVAAGSAVLSSIRRTQAYAAAVAAVALVALAILGPGFLTRVFGSDFGPSFRVTLILLAAAIPAGAGIWARPFYLAVSMQARHNWITSGLLVARTGLIVPLTFALGASGPAVAYLIANSLTMAVFERDLRYHHGMRRGGRPA